MEVNALDEDGEVCNQEGESVGNVVDKCGSRNILPIDRKLAKKRSSLQNLSETDRNHAKSATFGMMY